MALIDRLPWWLVIAAILTIGLAPEVPEPHVWEKLEMLWQGNLVRPIDIGDLALHATPWLLGVFKYGASIWVRRAAAIGMGCGGR